MPCAVEREGRKPHQKTPYPSKTDTNRPIKRIYEPISP